MARLSNTKSALLIVCALGMTDLSAGRDHELKDFFELIPVPPNVMITFDDSNSMRYDIFFQNQYRFENYVSIRSSVVAPYTDSFHNYSHPSTVFGQLLLDHGVYSESELIERPRLILDLDWRIRSPQMNSIYYDPGRTYKPIEGYDQADFHAVRLWPIWTENKGERYDTVLDLGALEFSFFVAKDTAGFDGFPSQDRINANPNGFVDLWDDHIRYTLTHDAVNIKDVQFDPRPLAHECSPVGIDDPYQKVLECFGATVTETTWNSVSTLRPFGRTLEEEKQNIANWFQYHRTRGLALTSAVVSAMYSLPKFRFGTTGFHGDQEAQVLPPPELDYDQLAHLNKVALGLLRTNNGPRSMTHRRGTPTLDGLIRGNTLLIDNSEGKSPIISACQQNYNLLVSDGLRDDTFRLGPVGDVDGDRNSDTLADIAYKYYMNDLRPDLPDIVSPVRPLCEGLPLVSHQHIKTLAIGFGLPPAVERDARGCWPVPEPNGAIFWSRPNPNQYPRTSGEMWFAAYNSAGYFSNVAETKLLEREIMKAFDVFNDRLYSFSGLSFSGGTMSEGIHTFQAFFSPGTNSGELKAYEFVDGQFVQEPLWSVNELISAGQFYRGQRRVLVYDAARKVTRMIVASADPGSNFNAVQRERLFDGVPLAQRDDLLREWIMKEKAGLLGPLLMTKPVYVGASVQVPHPETPHFDDFLQFQVKTQYRLPMVYAATADGFIHGFDANTGQEVFKLMPDTLIDKSLLTASSSDSRRYSRINGTLTVVDAYIEDRGWRTVLLVTFGSGAKGLIALDITDPNQIATNSSQLVLWEIGLSAAYRVPAFADEIGFIPSAATVALMEDDQWYVLFGNGHNATDTSSSVVIARLEDGMVVRTLNSNRVGGASSGESNGMAAPALIDRNRNGRVDRIYAGDFLGNLYSYDLVSTNFLDWGGSGGGPNHAIPLVSTGGAPITTRPAVLLREDGPFIIFGAGDAVTLDSSLAENWDYALYGVAHTENSTEPVTDFNEGTILRSSNGYQVDIDIQDGVKSWRVGLNGPLSGFQLLQSPEVQFGEARFVVQKPKRNEVQGCELTGLESVLLVLDPLTGAGHKGDIFNLGGDQGQADEDQPLNLPVAGIDLPSGNNSLTTVLDPDQHEVMISNSIDGKVDIHQRAPALETTGRRQWLPLVD